MIFRRKVPPSTPSSPPLASLALLPLGAAAGLWTTPSDLAQFLLAIMRSFDGDERALLSKDYAEEMLTVQAGKYKMLKGLGS